MCILILPLAILFSIIDMFVYDSQIFFNYINSIGEYIEIIKTGELS